MTPHRAIAAVFAAHGAVAGSLSTRIPWIQDHLHLSPATLGLAMLCPSIGAFLGMPVASRLAFRYGSRTATRALIALWCGGLALPALAPVPAALFVAFLLFGCAAGMSDVVMNAHAVELERHLDRPIMSGLHGMWSVGSLGAAGLGALAAQAGVDARLHLAAMSLALLALGAAAGRGLLPNHVTAAQRPAGAAPPRRFALPARGILLIGLVGFCATFAEGASANWSAVYLTRVTEAGPGLAAAAYTVLMLCMAGTRLLGDRIIRLLGPVTCVRAGGLVAVAGGVVVVTARTPLLAIAGFALLGLGVAVIMPLALAAAGNAGPTAGEGVAGVATITYLSGLTAPAVTGWLAGAFGYPAAFAFITAVVLLLPFLAPVLRPAAPRPLDPAGPAEEDALIPAAPCRSSARPTSGG
ncbi:MFS transporter [Actinomadura sp. ATCC 31491]|uniref:MFS transporter n=1 Tax=Actinomadura luzonensis TaxID=2805427 RepID=A0ABT0G5V5_9ACTN|nr:MFS transporter [Actinomadura luzonensis]MCK2219570.1 MFS transporter [Actinomadura luzonensis]